MLIAGVIALVVAGVLGFVAWRARARLEVMSQAETLRCGDLAGLATAASEAAGPGSFARVCEVAGAGQPGPQGALAGPESGTECIWYRTRVTEHYWDEQRDTDGDRRRVKRTRVVAEQASEAPLFVDDGSGTVLVDPAGADLDRAEKAHRRYEEAGGQGIAALASMIGLGGVGSRTAGLEYEEWVIRPGTALYVLGEASDRRGTLRVGKPDGGPLVISTRSEEELQRSQRRTVTFAGGAAAVVAVAGVALVAAGALA